MLNNFPKWKQNFQLSVTAEPHDTLFILLPLREGINE